MLKQIVRKAFHRLGYEISRREPVSVPPGLFVDPGQFYILPKASVTYASDMLYSFHNCDFIEDKRFKRAYALGKATDVNNTVLSNTEIYWRVYILCWAASQARHLPGDFVDCGVNTGIFSRAVIDYIDFNATGKTYYLLDTFEGLDERYSTPQELARELNQHYNHHKDGLVNQVQETFKPFHVKIIKGPIPETLPQVQASHIAYLSIDMNCVQPEIAALNYFWDKIVPGGIIILDDYGYCNAFMEQKHAHDEFARSHGVEILTLPTCQGMIIKPF
jgi:hypothetical protein